jgi:glycosyltransferase involved in cell wall biosynthesis
VTAQLHITNWYPNPFQPREAPYIREHFKALSTADRKELWHLQVRSEGGRFRLHRGRQGDRESYLILDTPITTWRVLEWLHLALLVRLRASLGRRWWDVVVVHIAYPLLRFPGVVKRQFGGELVIVEHWSAFHFGFNLEEGSAGRHRIQKIFQQGIPVMAVSEALLADIERFAGVDSLPGYVVPNVVDTSLFHPRATVLQHRHPVFLMVGNWAPIKRPLLAFEGIVRFLKESPYAELRVIGYGAQLGAMKDWVHSRGLEKQIRLLGPMDKAQIAEELRNTDALILPSEYETFSVVCAEALVSGTPVIASSVGGIPEFVDASNGILVRNEVSEWATAFRRFEELRDQWDRPAIAQAARDRFAPEVVGGQFDDILRRHARAA